MDPKQDPKDEPQSQPSPPTQDGKAEPTQDGTPTPDPDTATDWQKMARKWEREAKNRGQRLKDLEAKVQGLVSPEQVADKDTELASTKAELQAARLTALRTRVAVEAGLPLDMAERLLGDDEDSIRDDAKRLAALVRQPPKRTDAARDTNDKSGTGVKPDPNDLLRAALGR